ncbi:hypothetical protein AC249_AIPGENE9458 [Exaiptasia diaphana]|nr:hypothetical protein AC249_AIPGENE9458 [Exaiptasia diaphana]
MENCRQKYSDGTQQNVSNNVVLWTLAYQANMIYQQVGVPAECCDNSSVKRTEQVPERVCRGINSSCSCRHVVSCPDTIVISSSPETSPRKEPRAAETTRIAIPSSPECSPQKRESFTMDSPLKDKDEETTSSDDSDREDSEDSDGYQSHEEIDFFKEDPLLPI